MADGPIGLFEYSDLPMRDVIDLKDWSDLPGEKVYDYLHAYAEKFNLLVLRVVEDKYEWYRGVIQKES